MLTVMVFGDHMTVSPPIRIYSTLDVTDDVTLAMLNNVIRQSCAAVTIGRKLYKEGKPVVFNIQCLDSINFVPDVKSDDK